MLSVCDNIEWIFLLRPVARLFKDVLKNVYKIYKGSFGLEDSNMNIVPNLEHRLTNITVNPMFVLSH
jgi:hypothetical protein